jgi:hypothetical protein
VTMSSAMRALLVLCIVGWAAVSTWCTAQRQEHGADYLAATARMYEPVREHLEGVDQIGFASFKDSEHGYLMRYYVAQSVLAPTLVVESIEHDVVLASFSEDWRLGQFVARHPFTVLQRFDGGVAVLERKR